MGRLDHRMRRLTRQAQEIQAARQQAQLARMSEEELTARLVKAASVLGMPEEVARGDPEAAVRWIAEYRRKAEEPLPEEPEDVCTDPLIARNPVG